VTTVAAAESPQLRPLGVGDIVDRVFALYRARPLPFLAIAAVPYLLLVLVITGVALAFASSFIGIATIVDQVASGAAPDPALILPAIGSLVVFAFIVVIAAVVILSAQSAALVAAMGKGYLGKPITIGEAFREGLRAAPTLIVAGLLVFIALIVLWVVLILIAALSNQALVFAAASLAAIVGTVYIFSSTLVVPVVATIERVGPIQAIRRSWSLSTGNRWRIIGLQLLLIILNGVINGLLSAVFVTALISDVTARTIAQQIANVVATVAWAPVQWGTFAILYYDLRVRREAFDLQLAAEALSRQA
jgi:hypothetical protein